MDIAQQKSEHTRILLPLLILVAGIGAGAAGMWLLAPPRIEKAPPRTEGVSKEPKKVSALGRIQPKGGVLNLGIPLPDRLLEIYVHEDATVKKGQKLVMLESHAARVLDLDVVKRQLADAHAKFDAVTTKGKTRIEVDKLHLKQVQELQPLDLKLLRQQIKVLVQQAKLAHENLKRLEALGSTVSPQELEQQRLHVLQADTEATSAKQKLAKAEKGGALEIETARAQLEASKALLASAQKEIPITTLQTQERLAELRLQDSILRAPSPGKILKILARPGELVGAQQLILQMADTDHMIVIAEVYETDIHRVKIGAGAVVKVRALPKERKPNGDMVERELTGKVFEIGSMVGKNRIFDVDPTADVDRRVIDVKIQLDQSAPVAKLINHQVLVEIEP